MVSAGDKSTVLVAISMEEEEAELERDSTILHFGTRNLRRA